MPLKHHHGGHRARLRARFRRDPDSLEDHELLELLLFYAIPQKDTNALAHDLLYRFGSLSGVFNATPAQLTAVSGIGETSSQLFPAVLELFRRYFRERVSSKPSAGYDPEYIGSLYLSKFFGKRVEYVYVIALDENYTVVEDAQIGLGDLSYTPVNTVSLSGFIHEHKSCRFVIAHNHPSGIALPSEMDFKTTDFLRKYMTSCGAEFLDHLIFDGRGDFVSLGASGQMTGQNRFYYQVREAEGDRPGEVRYVFSKTPLQQEM